MCDIEFLDTLISNIGQIHIFGKIQLKIYMLAENMLKLGGIKLHMAMQPWLKFMTV